MKIRADDKGELTIAITETVRADGEKIIVIDFGKDLSWIGLDRKTAQEFALNILRRSADRYMSMKLPDE
jgi:hypothetical protein